MELNMRAKVQGRSSNVTYLPHGGQFYIRFFAPKSLEVELIRLYFGPLIGGSFRINITFLANRIFAQLEKLSIFDEILEFFSVEMGQGAVAKILSLTALSGPHIAHWKNWPPPLRILSH